jgi:hypothetical protein
VALPHRCDLFVCKTIAIDAATNSAIAKVGSVISSVNKANSGSSNKYNSGKSKSRNKYSRQANDDDDDYEEDFDNLLGNNEKLIARAAKDSLK